MFAREHVYSRAWDCRAEPRVGATCFPLWLTSQQVEDPSMSKGYEWFGEIKENDSSAKMSHNERCPAPSRGTANDREGKVGMGGAWC
jgi:hypothetical protein